MNWGKRACMEPGNKLDTGCLKKKYTLCFWIFFNSPARAESKNNKTFILGLKMEEVKQNCCLVPSNDMTIFLVNNKIISINCNQF